MNIDNYDNSIFICMDETKKSIINMISNSKRLLNIKVISLSELVKNYFFDYEKKTIYNVSKKYNCIYEVARIYIDNLYYLKDIDDDKVKFLYSVKEYLDNNHLLIYNPLFKSFLKNKKIVLYDLENIDKFYLNIIHELKSCNEIISINNNTFKGKKKLYRAKDKNEEVEFVASEIVSLIKSGIDINHIKLVNVCDDYIYTINKVFNEFNIPIEFNNLGSASGTIIVSKFIENYDSDINKTLDIVREYVTSNEDKKLYDSIVHIVNEYAWCDDYIDVKDIIINDVNNIKLPSKKYKNAVRCASICEYFSDDNYVFLMAFNEGIIPVTVKNEDYLEDKTKNMLGISDSVDLNVKRKNIIREKIGSIKNLVVTLSNSDLNGTLYISNAYSDDILVEEKIRIPYTDSNLYNKLKLISLEDEYKKYSSVSKNLIDLSNHYKDVPYNSFDNKYSGIESSKVYNYIGNKLNLSYSSMNTFYLCSFRYYLDNILKLNEFDDTFDTTLGNIFHEVLSKCFSGEDAIKLYDDVVNNVSDYEFNARDRFYLDKLRGELLFIIDIIKKQDEQSLLKNAEYEKKVDVVIDKDKNIVFKGFIDKIKYNDDASVVSIVDYKTGEAEVNLKNVNYGLSMQLPSYIYLLKNTNEFKNARIGGFYIQKILSNKLDEDKRIDDAKLIGYTNSDEEIAYSVDNTYRDSRIIKGLKLCSNGFHARSKVISDDEIQKLYDITHEKIINASNAIMSTDFNINPKEINGELKGCKYCKYRSICYMRNDDVVKLDSEENAI